MGIETTKSWADVPAGAQVHVTVADATYDLNGRFGPEVELELEVSRPGEYAGDTILSTFGLSQPRLNKVRDYRNDGLDDETIAGLLRKKGFDFEEIDDPESAKLGGALLKITKACHGNDARAVKTLLRNCGGFEELAENLIGKGFVATTRQDKNGYTRIDGKGEFYPVVDHPEPVSSLRQAQQEAGGAAPDAEVPPENEEDFDDIPF